MDARLLHAARCAADASLSGRAAARRRIGWGLCLTVLLAGCGGGSLGSSDSGAGVGVPSASEIAAAQAALDGSVPTDNSIAARQAALDADADRPIE